MICCSSYAPTNVSTGCRSSGGVAVANPAANLEAVLAAARTAHDEGVGVAVFPELCLSGYAIDDLLLQDALRDAVQDAVAELVTASAELLPVLVVGAPLAHGNRVHNVALVVTSA